MKPKVTTNSKNNGRPTPRMSVNKLAEYAASNSAARRRTILKNQKYPKDFITTIYNDSLEPALDFLTDPAHSPIPVQHAIQALQSRTVVTKRDEMIRDVNSEALDHLLSVAQQMPFGTCTFRKASHQSVPLVLKGVSVSVRPEIELVVNTKAKGVRYGLVKLYLSKNHPLTDESGAFVSTLLHQFAESHFGAGAVDRTHCIVVDVFQKKVFVAPKAYIRLRSELEAACEVIALHWPAL